MISGFEELSRETFLQDRLAKLQTEFNLFLSIWVWWMKGDVKLSMSVSLN
jgi:hypothetical protein